MAVYMYISTPKCETIGLGDLTVLKTEERRDMPDVAN